MRPRIIPALLLLNNGLVKTIKFRNPKYLGDPINIVRIFNEKEVDELVFLDIAASVEGRHPPFEILEKITSECFMPLGYGGGIRTLEDVKTLLRLGVEKVILNTHALEYPSFVREIADYAGSQAVVVSLDVRSNLFGRQQVYIRGGRKSTGRDPVSVAVEMEKQGAGELLLNSIERDGTMRGYDLELIRQVSVRVGIPVIACGGAGHIQHLAQVIRSGGASAAAAGSLFVFQGPLRAVLISYPSPQELRQVFLES